MFYESQEYYDDGTVVNSEDAAILAEDGREIDIEETDIASEDGSEVDIVTATSPDSDAKAESVTTMTPEGDVETDVFVDPELDVDEE